MVIQQYDFASIGREDVGAQVFQLVADDHCSIIDPAPCGVVSIDRVIAKPPHNPIECAVLCFELTPPFLPQLHVDAANVKTRRDSVPALFLVELIVSCAGWVSWDRPVLVITREDQYEAFVRMTDVRVATEQDPLRFQVTAGGQREAVMAHILLVTDVV
jgi:hypothetical protein